jgi:Cu+-exporting ATPase
MGVALTPSVSGALMGLSSLAVMANSLLLQLEAGPRKLPARAAVPRVVVVEEEPGSQRQAQPPLRQPAQRAAEAVQVEVGLGRAQQLSGEGGSTEEEQQQLKGLQQQPS